MAIVLDYDLGSMYSIVSFNTRNITKQYQLDN